MPSLRDIHNQHSRYQDAMVQAFEQHLREMVLRVQGQVLAELQGKLSITDGLIEQTSGNLRVLRNLNNLFVQEMDAAGFPQLLESFVREFPGQLPYLQQVLDFLNSETDLDIPVLAKPIEWTVQDKNVLNSLQANTVSGLETAVEISAGLAMQRAMLSVGGLKFSDLVESLTQKFETSVGQARSMADTAMSTFYRTAQDRAFQQIQKGQKAELKYRYSGPEDKLTRPFCEHLLEVDKSYTREQIERMHNGQLPNVFLTAGGWNCRHQWIVDTASLEEKARQAA